jgi:hypothetical protein
MKRLGIEKHVVDRGTYENSVARFREARIPLPTFTQLADPAKISPAIHEALSRVDPDAPHPLNLFRVHWYNGSDRRHLVPTPGTCTASTGTTRPTGAGRSRFRSTWSCRHPSPAWRRRSSSRSATASR